MTPLLETARYNLQFDFFKWFVIEPYSNKIAKGTGIGHLYDIDIFVQIILC